MQGTARGQRWESGGWDEGGFSVFALGLANIGDGTLL